MNCFYHPEITIVATCQDCRKGLCKTCASKYKIPICENCNSARISNEVSKIKNEIRQVFIIAFIAALIITYSFADNCARVGFDVTNDAKVIFIIWGIVSFIYSIATVIGWKSLNKLTPGVFLILPLIGWLIYFSIKFYISLMIGIFVSPFWFYRKIKRLKQLKFIQQQKQYM